MRDSAFDKTIIGVVVTRDSSNSNLPPWLQGVPLPPRPGDSPAGAAGLPAWLPAAEQPAVPEPLPDWLAAAGAATESAEPLPDWLRGLADDQPAPVEPEATVPGWLQEQTPGSAPASPAAPPIHDHDDQDDALPDWLSLPATPSEAPPEPAAVIPPAPSSVDRARAGGFTSWLSGGAAGMGEQPPAPASAPSNPPPSSEVALPSNEPGDLPAWLRAEASAVPSTPSGEQTEALPDWLHDRAPGEPAAPVADPHSEPASWLAEPETLPAPEPTIPGSFDRQPPAPVESAEPDVPNWLQQFSDQELAQISPESDPDLPLMPFALEGEPVSASAGADDLPAWLQAEADEGEDRPAGEATSWLGASASQLVQPPAPAPDEADIPAWLRDSADKLGEVPDAPDTSSAWLAQPPQREPLPGAEPREAGMPDWLESVSDASVPAELPAITPDQPEWLVEAVRTDPPDLGLAPEIASEPALPSSDLPAWLRESSASVPAEPTPASSDLPTWLRESSASVPAEPTPSSDLPTWLQNSAPPASSPASTELPPWLQDESGAPLPTAVAPGDANLPDWLRGADPQISAAALEPEPVLAPTPTPNRAGFDLLGDMDVAAPASTDLLGGAELPAWLRRDTEKPREAAPTDIRSMEWFTTITADDELAPAVASEARPRLTVPAPPQRSQAQIEALALLRRMATAPYPAEAVAPEVPVPGALGRFGAERLSGLLLLILIIAGLVVPGLSDSLSAPIPAPGAAELAPQIAALGENDIVLLGYEWDAQRVGEFRPLEQAVIGQLIKQRVQFILVSTDPQGTLLQFDLRDELTRQNYQPAGDDYILLGYRPGGEIALRQLARDLRGTLQRDFQGFDATRGRLAADPARLSNLDDFALILVLADEATDVQGWMEQVKPATKTPLAFLVPASVEPQAAPYFRRPGVFHVAGSQGALAFAQQQNSATPVLGQSVGQLRLSTLVFAVLLALGTIVMLISNVARRRNTA